MSKHSNDFDLVEDVINFEKQNDAELTGEPCNGFEALLSKEVTVSFCTSAKQKRLAGQLTSWRALIEGGENGGVWGLSRHPVKKKKDGRGFVFGDCKGERKAKSVSSICAISLDHDTGDVSFAEAVDKIIELNVAAICYTTFSHRATQTSLRRDDVMKFARLADDPSIDDVKEYLSQKKRLAEHIVASAVIEEDYRETSEGVMIVVRHDPIDKYRVVFPLAEGDIALRSLTNGSQADQQAIVKARVLGMSELVGIPTDPATLDVSRLFYAPRHPEGAYYDTVIHRAPPISFDDIPSSEPETSKRRKPRERLIADNGTDVTALYDRYAKRWALADILESAGLGTSASADDSGGKIHIVCPFADGHTDSADDTATCAWNAEDASNEFAVIKCHHASCADRHTTDYLRAWLDSGELTLEDLENPEFMLPFGDDQTAEKYFMPSPEEVAEGLAPIDRSWIQSPFFEKDEIIYKKSANEDDPDRAICQSFEVVGRSSNMTGETGASRIIRFSNENGVTVELTIDRADLFRSDSGGVIDRLADAGMDLYFAGKNGRMDMGDLLRTIQSKKHIPLADRPGWARDASGAVMGYVCPTGEYISAGVGQRDMRLHSRATVRETRSMGSLVNWQKAASAARENVHWQLGLCMAFAGPVLGLIEDQPCGFNLSGDTSRGKTIALMLGTSAWTTTANSKGVFHVMNSTANAIEDLATMSSDCFLALDEIGAMQNPQGLGATLFGLSSASGKSRKAGRGPGLAESAEFRPVVMTTHERSLKSTVVGAGGEYKSGLGVRFPDVSVTASVQVGSEVIAQLELAKTNFGHAGPAFVRWLIAEGWHTRIEELKGRLKVAAEQIAGEGAPDGLRRAAGVFALAQVAGELAADAGLIDETPIIPAIQTAFTTFKSSDEGAATCGGKALFDAFKALVAREMNGRIVDASGSDERAFASRLGWYTGELIVLDYEIFSNLKPLGLSGTRAELLKALNAEGVVIKSGKNNAHSSLPADIQLGGREGGAVKNIRIDRAVLGI